MTSTQRILDQIASAQKLSEGATPGPWTPQIHEDKHHHYRGWNVEPVATNGEYPYHCISDAADALFIAASRMLIPRLARQLEEAVKALEEIHAKDNSSFSHNRMLAREALSRIEQLGLSE